MRSLKHSVLISVVVLSFAFLPASAQNVPDAVRRNAQKVILEKLKIPLERLEEFMRGETGNEESVVNKRSILLADGEILVSGDALPESEVHAAINPADPSNIVVSPIRLNPNNFQESLLCPVYYTKDFGLTWSKSSFKTLPKEPGALVAGGGDPVFAFDADGKLYLSWINLYLVGASQFYMGIFWAFSTDGGANWKRETNDIIGKAKISLTAATEAYDKQWLAADATNSAYRNTLYAAFFHPDQLGGLKIEVRRKPPDSLMFSTHTAVVSSPDFKFVQFTSITVDPLGGVHVTFFGSKDSITFSLYHALSSNGAQSFDPPTKISDVNLPQFSANDRNGTVPGIQDSRIYPCPHIVCDHSSQNTRGFLYTIWSGNGIGQKEPNGMDVYFSRSTDNGMTWSTPIIVNDDTKGMWRDQFHPGISVNGNGVIAVIWYDRRNDMANTNTQLYYAQSADGGLSFTRNRPVASKSMDMSKAGLENGNFGIGEYNQVLMTNDYTIPFWSDGRENDGNLDVYGAFIPINAATPVERIGAVSEMFELDQNIPNPVSGSASISYAIRKALHVRLVVHDLLGRELFRLVDDRQSEGRYSVSLDATGLAKGEYYYTLFTDLGYRSMKFTVVR